MASLLKLLERYDLWDNKKKQAELGEDAMQVLTRGLEVRPDRTDGQTFWDDFVTVLSNNSEGAANLLGINRETISGWSSRIKEGLKRIREQNVSKDKTDMIQTGD